MARKHIMLMVKVFDSRYGKTIENKYDASLDKNFRATRLPKQASSRANDSRPACVALLRPHVSFQQKTTT